jgi:beta-lactamase regulating signal transducer with metallopeptidase domain
MLNFTIENLNSRGDAWAVWLGTSILDAALVLALAAMLWTIVRKRASVQLGYCLFLLVLVKLLVPLEVTVPRRLAQWTPGQMLSAAWTLSEMSEKVGPGQKPAHEARWSVPQSGPQAAAWHGDASIAYGEYDAQPPSGMNRRLMDENTPAKEVVVGNISSEAGVAVSPLGSTAMSGNKSTYPSLLGGVMLFWAIGVCVLAVRLVSVQILFHRRLRKAKPVDVVDLPVDFSQLCARAGLKRRVRFVESDAVASPAVWGIWRPVVILPQGMARSLRAAQLEWILLHELAHIRRHDLAVNCFQRLVTIVHFMNPAVWAANRMINRLREYSCDDVASALTGGPQIESSQAFMGVVRYAAQDRSRLKAQFSGALGAFDSSARASCFQRMTRLLDTDRRLRVRLGLGSLCVLLLTAALTLPHIRAASQAGATLLKPRFHGVVTGHVDTYQSGTGTSADLIRGKQMVCGFHYGDAKKTDWTSEIYWELIGHHDKSDMYRFRLVYTSPTGNGVPVSTTKEVQYDGKTSVIVFRNGSETVSIEPGSIPLNPGGKRSDGARQEKTAFAKEPPNTDTGWRRFELTVVGPDGEAVPNARIEVRRSKPEQWTIHAGSMVEVRKYGTLMTADSNGRLAFDLLAGKPISLALKIQTDGYGPFWAEWDNSEHSEPIPPRYTAHLDAGMVVGGIVVDENGEPIEGAEIYLRLDYKKREGDTSQLGTGARPKTDSRGKWSYPCVPASLERLWIEIKHPRYMPLRTAVSTSKFAVQNGKEPTAKTMLERGITVTGKVTDKDGADVAGAIVRTKFMNDQREAKTSPDGVYTLVGCEPVRTAIVVTAKGHAPDLKNVLIEPGMSPVDFTLQAGQRIRVRVTDADGNPIPRTRIFFQDWRGNRHDYELGTIHEYTDENGVWQWNDAPADPVICDICPPGGMTLGRQTLLARDEEYVFTPPLALVITGRVLDAQTKQPIEKVRVVPGFLFRNGQIGWSREESFDAEHGTYRVKHTHDRLARLIRIEAEGYRAAVSREIKSDEGSVTIDFELSKGANVDTQVLSPDGTPVSRAEVALGTPDAQIFVRNGEISYQSTYCDRRLTDAEGRFSFPPQETPFELLITHAAGYAQVESQPDAPPRTIRLQPWARVEGTLRAGTKPVVGEDIELHQRGLSYRKDAANINISNEGVTGNDGRFTFDRVVPGKGRIGQVVRFDVTQTSSANTWTHCRPIDLPPGKTVRVDLGGTGRSVVGKLTPPSGLDVQVDWNFALAQLVPTLPDPPPAPIPDEIRDDDKARTAWGNEWLASDEGKAWQKQQEAHNALIYAMHRYAASIDPDGSFRLDDIPAGEYELTVRLQAAPAGGERFAQTVIGTLRHVFTVPKMDGGRFDQPLDLGELVLEKFPLRKGK